MSINENMREQFKNPQGLAGKIATTILNKQNERPYQGAIKSLALQDNEVVAEIGFGNGYLLERLAHDYHCLFYGIDISADMVELANERNDTFIKEQRMFLKVGDALKTGYENDFFNKVFTINTVYFWDDLELGLQEMYRILKTNGIFVNGVYTKEFLDTLPVANEGYIKYSLEVLKAVGLKVGFREVIINEVIKDKAYSIVYQK
ncbi:MAG: class I SAM-dependent methyltransferase [Bacilli bacterium]|jgi:ubiquinone/menaquinone biosynthesis C-methylase UbiE|nr:class I SAM-dependent methyltransferase [Bacilli bacterium]